jgi:hypothetical protein
MTSSNVFSPGSRSMIGESGKRDQSIPGQSDHPLNWQKSYFFAGKDFKFIAAKAV